MKFELSQLWYKELLYRWLILIYFMIILLNIIYCCMYFFISMEVGNDLNIMRGFVVDSVSVHMFGALYKGSVC